MKEGDRIVDQLRRAFDGNAWHGPALSEILEDVDAKGAAAKPIDGAHSIWEIVLHLIGTEELVLRRMQGIATELTPEEDWPTVSRATEQSWARAKRKLETTDARLRKRVAAFDDEMLDRPLVRGGSPAYDNFHGVVQHNLYHAGQIVMLKKRLAAR